MQNSKKAGEGFTLPPEGTLLTATTDGRLDYLQEYPQHKQCTDGMYHLDEDSDELTEVKFLTSPEGEFFGGLCFDSLRTRTKVKSGGKKKSKSKKEDEPPKLSHIKFLDYDVLTAKMPKGEGAGAKRSHTMIKLDGKKAGSKTHIPDHNVVAARFVWKHRATRTEEQRKRELKELLEENGIDVTENGSDSDESSDSEKSESDSL